MNSISYLSSSINSLLSSYYTRNSYTAATGVSADNSNIDSTEETGTLGREEITSISLSLPRSLVNVLSLLSGTDTDDDSNGLSSLFDAIEMQQNADSIYNSLLAYYTDKYTDSGSKTGSIVDITA